MNSIFDIKISIEISSREFGMNILGSMKPYGFILFPDLLNNCEVYGWMEYDIILEAGIDDSIIKLFKGNGNIFNFAIQGKSSTFLIMCCEKELKNIRT